MATAKYVNVTTKVIYHSMPPTQPNYATKKVFTLPEQTPYVARLPPQQKQNPGGFVSALAEYLQSHHSNNRLCGARLID